MYGSKTITRGVFGPFSPEKLFYEEISDTAYDRIERVVAALVSSTGMTFREQSIISVLNSYVKLCTVKNYF